MSFTQDYVELPIQKIALYATRSQLYLIGSNSTMTGFRVLRINRLEPRKLNIINDKKIYSQRDIQDMIKQINLEKKDQQSDLSNIIKIQSAFGIIGFVRFLEGYYIVLITKRRRIAVIGHHTIYKVEDSSMIYIPHESIRLFHTDEQRYVKMFQNIDLSSNFYFSYSYDISSSLQRNIENQRISIPQNQKNIEQSSNKERMHPNKRFVWNLYLSSQAEGMINDGWIIYLIHGFVGQSNISIFGRSVYITIIARRSSKYAGTRFLKRGINFDGDVANEVETEQIVHDCCISSLSKERISSFIQLRGSVPCHWSQDSSKIVPKPSIVIDLSDPFVETAGAHFSNLFYRYGSPIFILNLVKKREKKKHESILTQEMNLALNYLNQFLPGRESIQYINFDMASKNKRKKSNVIGRLTDIANAMILKIKFFQSAVCYGTSYFSDEKFFQSGLIRTNCVDCLDRTNTAQFVIGKCALAHQLCGLGLLNTPDLNFDTDSVRMLEELYEDHGDTLALQYGGSQLVHRVRTYRKTSPWTSQGNDIMQTLSRYYSNTFSDQEKQQTINLFLGFFIPEEGKAPIWETITDYYLHQKDSCKYRIKEKPLTHWWTSVSPYCISKEKNSIDCKLMQNKRKIRLDIFHDFYRPHELSLLMEVYSYQISHSVRDFMPHFTTNFSPFTVRVRPGRRIEEAGNKNLNKNSSLTRRFNATNTQSSTSSSSISNSDDENSTNSIELKIATNENEMRVKSFEDYFTVIPKMYNLQIHYPSKTDLKLYKNMVSVGKDKIPSFSNTDFSQAFTITDAKVCCSRNIDAYILKYNEWQKLK